jgi:hypothetical protein
MKKTSESKDPSVLASANYNAYLRLRDNGHSDWVVNAQKQSDFYLGEQWSDADRKALEDEGRPALTMNAILSTVNTLQGELIQNQADIQFKPLKGGDENTAQFLNAIWREVHSRNDVTNREQQVLLDGIIEDRGFWDVRVSFDDNILGDITLDVEDGTQVLIDNEARDRDPRTWSEVIITRWLTLDEIEVQYGKDKRTELESGYTLYGSVGEDSLEVVEARRFGNDTAAYSAADDDTKRIRRARIIERQFYKLTSVRCAIDPQSGEIREIPLHWTMDRVQALMAQGYQLQRMPRRKVRIVSSCDRVLLSDDWSPYRTFTIIPFFPYFRRGNPRGVVSNLISPQELLNKTTSQELHIVNSTANSGWVVEEDSLSNMTTDELAENGSKTGIVIEYRRGAGNAPEKIQPNSLPSGIDRISMKASGSIREISGVNAAMAGAVGAHEVSGVAVREQTARGQVQAIPVEESLKWTRRQLALKVLELVQDFYTEGRIIYVTDPLDPTATAEPVVINGQDEMGNVPNDVTVGRYEVTIGTMPNRDTVNEMEFAQLMQMREAGIQIPDHIIIEKSNLSSRRELAKFIMDLQGFGELTEEQQQEQAMQQELQMQMAQAELDNLLAKAESLRAAAAQSQAKADSLQGYNQAAIELAKLDVQIEGKQNELSLRRQLASLSYDGQLKQNHRNNATKMALEVVKSKTKKDDTKKPTPKKDK